MLFFRRSDEDHTIMKGVRMSSLVGAEMAVMCYRCIKVLLQWGKWTLPVLVDSELCPFCPPFASLPQLS